MFLTQPPHHEVITGTMPSTVLALWWWLPKQLQKHPSCAAVLRLLGTVITQGQGQSLYAV
jgi:hypothetical protein